ncbi:MAG: hypothetical protein BIFFINMI_00388 [Phycisphaerae bacterium]|nr:hypothetical protein [Phycisphaerae bacterium]
MRFTGKVCNAVAAFTVATWSKTRRLVQSAAFRTFAVVGGVVSFLSYGLRSAKADPAPVDITLPFDVAGTVTLLLVVIGVLVVGAATIGLTWYFGGKAWKALKGRA